MRSFVTPVFICLALISAPAAAQTSALYEGGAVRAGWAAQSAAPVTVASTAVLDGTAPTLQVELPAGGSVRLAGTSTLRPGTLDTLLVRVHASSAGAVRVLALGNRGGWTFVDVRLSSYCPGGVLPVGSFADCQVPLRALGVGRSGFVQLEFREVGGAPLTLHFGAIRVAAGTRGMDTTPPTVAVTAPVASATVSGTVTLRATASDAVGVVGVQFLVDGQVHGAEDPTSPYEMQVGTGALSNGPHVLGARARDAAGNVATSSVSVTVANVTADTTPPTVAVTAPVANATVSGSVALSATASDALGVVGVQFLVDGQAHGAEDLTAPFGATLDATSLSTGAHTVSARARDAAGNVGTAAVVPISVGTGPSATATYTSFATLPAHSDGVPTSAQWAHGGAMFVKDVQGGDLVGFFRGTSSLRAAVSVNDGASWSWVNPSAAVAAPEPLAVAQGPDGKVHLIGWSWALGVGYTRLTLVRNSSGHVTGFSADVASLSFPSSPNPADVSADLVVGTDSSGTPTLFWALYDDFSGSNRGRVVCGKTAPSVGALPTQSAHFVSLANGAGATQLELLGSNAWASPHNAGVLLAQHPVSKDVWFQWGPMNTGDGLTQNALPLKRARATPSGASAFTVGSPVTVASFSAGWGVQNYVVFATSASVWFMYGTASSAVVIDKVNAAGVVTPNALPSPLPSARSGGAFALNVNGAETRAWFGGRVGEDADPAMPNVVKFWNGSAWTSFTDSSSFVGFRMSRSSGWDQGLVMLQNNFDYTTHRPWVGTLRSP